MNDAYLYLYLRGDIDKCPITSKRRREFQMKPSRRKCYGYTTYAIPCRISRSQQTFEPMLSLDARNSSLLPAHMREERRGEEERGHRQDSPIANDFQVAFHLFIVDIFILFKKRHGHL